MKVSSDKASKKVKTSKKKSIVKDSSSNKVSNKNQIKKASIKNVKSLDNSKKNTSTKKIEKNAQIQSSQEEITQNDVLHMTSQMMSSMNEKLRSLEQVKKNLEEKLNEVDSKVSKTQTNSKKNSNNTYKNTSGNKNINSSKTISNTLTKNTQKEVEELLLLTTKNIKKIHSTTNSSQEFIKPYIDSLEEFEAKLRLLHQKLISKSNTSKEIKNLTKQITNVIKDYTNKTQKFLLTKVKNSSPLSIQKDSTNILEEISKSKKHLQHLINKKVDLKELNQIIEPIENRINSTIETLQVVEKHDEEQFNELQNQLINSKKEIESQIINLEKEEHKKVSKKEYKEDIKNLQEELTHTIETLNLVDSKEKNLQIAIAKLQKEELSLKSLIHTINERSSLQTTKEDVSKEISMIKNQITNAFKSIEQLNFLEHKEFKTLKNKLNLKFKFFENKFVELDSKYINLVSKNELNFIKKELTQNIKKIIEVLNKNEIKEKHLEEDFNSLKNLVNLMNSEKIDLVKLKSELSPINNLILNLKKQDSKKINYLKHNLNESVKIVEDKISKIEDEEKKKVSKSSYTKDMNKLHNDINVVITDLEKSNISEKELSKHIKALELSKFQIEKELKSLSLKESKDVSKEYVTSQINLIEGQINNAFKAIEQSRFLEQKEMKSLKNKLNKKFSLVVSNFEDLNKKYSNAVTTKQFKEHQSVLRQEVLAIVDTLKRANLKEKNVEKQIKSLLALEKNLESSISSIENTLEFKVEVDELNNFENQIHKELEKSIKQTFDELLSLKSIEEKDIKDLKSKINSRIVTIQNIISSFNSHHNRAEAVINNQIDSINLTINEIVKTLKRASLKEKSLEKLVLKLEEADKEELEKISQIQEKFKSYYTKKQLNYMLEHINEEYEHLKLEMINNSQLQSDNLHELEYSLQEQKYQIESKINDLNNINHKTFATKSFTSKQLKDLKTLEVLHSKIQKRYTDEVEKNQKQKNKEHQLRVEALRNSLSELYNKSLNFMSKSQARKEFKELSEVLTSIEAKEKKDVFGINVKLNNLANTFANEISTIFKNLETLSSKEEVEKIKSSLIKKLQETSKHIEDTQSLLAKQSLEQSKRLKKEHSDLLNVEKCLQSKVEALHMSLLENYYTKSQINSIKKEFNTELEKLHSIQDANIAIVEDELTDLYKKSLAHQKKLLNINKKIKHDEDIMSTHQEVIDVSAALQETLMHSKKQLQKRSTQQINELMQEIKALLSSQSDRERKVQELNKKVQKTYSKEQLDKVFIDIADEVERVKLHEEEEFKQIKEKELKDVSSLTSKTKELESRTQIDYLKEHLTEELEKRVQELKEEQLRHYDEISKIQAHEQRLDTTEDLLAQKEELLEEKIQNQFEILEQAKSHWEEFFTNIKNEIEADEDSLSKALSSIEFLKQDIKAHFNEISTLKKSQTPLKQYLVEKYNILVDAFHKMQKEQKLYEEELKKRQDEMLSAKFNEYYQEILAYQNQITDLQSYIDEYIDSKNAHTYKEFENTMNEYKKEYSNEIIQVQSTIQQYLEQIKSDEEKYSNLMKQYVDKVNTKIVEINELEANFDDLLIKAKEEVNEYIHNSIDKIELSVESIVNTKTDEFLQREITLLASYHEKIQHLEDLTNKRLDKIEDKFIEKHTESIRHKINEEVASIDSKIEELRSLQKESLEHEERIEEKLLYQVQEIDKKSDETTSKLMQLVDEFKQEFFHLEREGEKLRDSISQKVEERITHFEQHINKRYLESDQEIAYIKEVLVNEIEGLMRDSAQEIETKKIEVENYILSILQGSNILDTIDILKEKVEQLEFKNEGFNANLVFSEDTEQTSQVQNYLNYYASQIEDLKNKVEDLSSSQEGFNANLVFSEDTEQTSQVQNYLNYYASQVEDLKDKYSKLESHIELNSAYSTLNDSVSPSNMQEDTKEINLLSEKLSHIEAEQERLNVKEALDSSFTNKETQDYILEKFNLFEEEFNIIKSQVQANSAFQTLNDEFDSKLHQLFNNQKKLAHEFKKKFVELEKKLAHNSEQIYNLEFLANSNRRIISEKNYNLDSHKLVNSMKLYESNLINMIRELHKIGKSKEEIEEILIQKGHPIFYVKMVLDYI